MQRLSEETIVKEYKSSESAVGVALVAHGLNLNPERMEPIIHRLNQLHLDAYLVRLQGHRSGSGGTNDRNMKPFKTVSADKWIREFLTAYRLASSEAEKKNIPLYFAGFSLGGLIGSYSLMQQDDVHFSKMILFSPAIRIRLLVHLLRPLQFLPSLVIPSSSPEKYRENPGTPMAAYSALYYLYDTFNGNMESEKLNIPTLLMLDPDDEFISERGIDRLIEEYDLSNWAVYHVSKDGIDRNIHSHLIINQEVVGEQSWEEMWRQIKQFIISE